MWFPEGPGGDRFTEKSFHGPLHRMVREALDYIRRNYINETVIKHPDRAEASRVENFPYAAVEESVVNAIYHRSYEEREPVEVRITPQDLVVLSFPGPDRSIRMAGLRAGRAVARRYRNRRIGEFLKELDLTEGRATGIPKILRAMIENGSPAPEFETDDDRASFLARIPVHPEARPLANGLSEDGKSRSGEGTDPVSDQVSDLVGDPVSKAILTSCRTPRSTSELLQALGFRHRTHFRENYLRPLIEAGLLARTLPEKPQSRLQKYVTTDAGRRHG